MADDIQVISGTEAAIAARLCNFVTAKSFLLQSHMDWLDQNVLPVIQSLVNPWVDLYGYASRTGNFEFNRQLSFQRCESVKSWVGNYSERTNFQIEWAKGESESGPDESNNDGYWRAVEIYVFGQPHPPAPDIPTPGPTEFRIRVVGGATFSPFLKEIPIPLPQGDGYFFQIVDTLNNRTAFFLFSGLGLGLPGVPPGSMTEMGPFVRFTTTQPVHLESFAGAAQLFQDPGINLGSMVSLGNYHLSIESENLLMIGAGVRPSIIEIPSGWALGAGLGSATPGRLHLVSDILPFSGV